MKMNMFLGAHFFFTSRIDMGVGAFDRYEAGSQVDIPNSNRGTLFEDF